MNTIIECMKNHRSIRQYDKRDITDETLHEILEASRWASTSSNFQAYSVIVIRSSETKEKLASLCGNQKHIINAPVFLVFVADLYKLSIAMKQAEVNPKFDYLESFIVSAVDTALVGQNVLLAAESFGLGGVFIGGIRNESAKVHELLDLPELTFPLFGMCLGYPDLDKVPEQKPRLPIEAFIHKEEYEKELITEHINQYDRKMKKYYTSRTDSKRNDTWSDYVGRLHTEKTREHLRTYLEEKGFGFN